MTSPNKPNSPEKKTPQKSKKGKTTKELMKAHMADKKHKITDEDIENLDLKLGHAKKAPRRPETITPSKDDRPEEEKKPGSEGPEHKKQSTWDVLGG